MNPPPDGIKRVYEEILADIEAYTAKTIRAFRAEVPDYRFPYEIHHRDNVISLTMQLRALIAGEEPSLEALEHARDMARRRFEFNVPLNHAIAGYHISFRELWSEVVRRTGPDAAMQSQLPREVERVWGWLHLISSAYAEEYVTATRSRALTGADSLRRLLSAPGPNGGGQHLDDVAVDLGYDLDQPFRAFVSTVRPPAGVARLNTDLAGLQAVVYSATVDQYTAVVAQGLSAEDGVALLRNSGMHGPIAVGLARRDAGGIRESFVDGMRLLDLPRGNQDVREFEREWPLTVLYADRDRMRELLAPGIAAAGDRHIAETIVAFATHGYSISAAARTLHIHPNTARYRISRWRELTGWDVFTVHGLLSSLAALQDADESIMPHDLGGTDSLQRGERPRTTDF